MKKFMSSFMSMFVLVALFCATNAYAFSFDFNNTKVIEVNSEAAPLIPFWQSAAVAAGDTFSQYCIYFLRNSGLNHYYSQRDCFDAIKRVNGYTESQLHLIYPGQIVWLPSLQNVRRNEGVETGPFVNIAQLPTLLGLDELEVRVDALSGEALMGERMLETVEGVVENILPDTVTSEVDSTDMVESEDNIYVPWWIFLLTVLLIFLVLLAMVLKLLRPVSDNTARQTANLAKTTADAAKAKAAELEVSLKKAATKVIKLEAVSKTLADKIHAVDKKVSSAQAAADESGELAASAMALLRFGDFKVVDGYPTQTCVEKLEPGEEIVVKLAHIDNVEDIRKVYFTCVADAFNDGRDGLKIDGITNQRRPIAKQLRSIATALANGARANHLQGVERKESKQQRRQKAS